MNETYIFAALLVAVAAVALWGWKTRKESGDVTYIAAQQLKQARIQALEHRAAAEHHKALADMFAARASRLELPSDTQFAELTK